MWTTPKVDWRGEVVDGVYKGDYFNAKDFNRIKNNLIYLRDLAVKMYETFQIQNVSADKTAVNYFYADEINKMEQNLNTINTHTLKRQYGDTPTYVDNGNTMDFNELNRLERASLDLYNRLTNQSKGRRMFSINFGIKGGL